MPSCCLFPLVLFTISINTSLEHHVTRDLSCACRHGCSSGTCHFWDVHLGYFWPCRIISLHQSSQQAVHVCIIIHHTLHDQSYDSHHAQVCLLLQLPDYVVVCVCPLAGLSRVSHEHLAVALALEVPMACVITKADVAPPEAVHEVLCDIRFGTPSQSLHDTDVYWYIIIILYTQYMYTYLCVL